MFIRLNLRVCAMLMCLLPLYGCATAPSAPPGHCPPPAQPPADLMQPAKPEGWGRERLLQILREAGILDPA